MEIRQSFEVIISYLKLFQWCDINFIYNLNSKRAICEIDKKVFDVNLFIHNLQFQRIEDWKYIHWWQICTPEKLEWTHPFVLWNLQIKGKYAVLNWNIVYRPVILTSSEEEFERQKKINEKKKLAKDLVKRINNTEEIQDKINALYKNILVNNYNLYKFNWLDYVIKNWSDWYYWCLVDSFASCYNKIRTWWTKITNILDNESCSVFWKLFFITLLLEWNIHANISGRSCINIIYMRLIIIKFIYPYIISFYCKYSRVKVNWYWIYRMTNWRSIRFARS